jgi:hydrogenase maturation protease
MKSTLVVGIGNILLRDEGVGVRVIEAMRNRRLPEGLELLDGGTRGVDLIDHFCDRGKVIVVDALDADLSAGSVMRLMPEDLASKEQAISLHELGLLETLAIARQLGCAPGEVVIFGIQTAAVEPGLELSPAVAAVVDRVIELVLKEVG